MVFLPVTDSADFGVEEIDDEQETPSSLNKTGEEDLQQQILYYPNESALYPPQQHSIQHPSSLPTHPPHVQQHTYDGRDLMQSNVRYTSQHRIPYSPTQQVGNVFRIHHMERLEQEASAAPPTDVGGASLNREAMDTTRDSLLARRQDSELASTPDEEMALQLSMEEADVMTSRDAWLAQQLQMRENSYMKPRQVNK